MAHWENWARTVKLDRLRKVYRPRDINELSENVREAVRNGWKLRAVGSGHAWSNLGLPGDGTGALIELKHLTQVLDVRPGEHRVTVMGGATIKEFTEELHKKGYALQNLGDANPQTVAGAVSTETHGSGAGLGSLSEEISAIRIVRADGSWPYLKAAELPAGRVSIGKLGVIYAVEFRVVDAYNLEHFGNLVPVASVTRQHVESLLGWRHLEYWYYPYAEYMEEIKRRITDDTQIKDPVDPFEKFFTRLATDIVEFKGKIRPESLPAFFHEQIRPNNPLFRDEVHRIGPWHKMLLGQSNVWREAVKTYTMEYQFALAKFDEAFHQLRESIERAKEMGVYVAAPVQFRFTKKSGGSLLSHLRHDPTVSFSVSAFRTHKGAHTWLPDLEQRFLALGGLPHWGKMYYQQPDIPTEFQDVRSRFDPSGVFDWPQPAYTPDPRAFARP